MKWIEICLTVVSVTERDCGKSVTILVFIFPGSLPNFLSLLLRSEPKRTMVQYVLNRDLLFVQAVVQGRFHTGHFGSDQTEKSKSFRPNNVACSWSIDYLLITHIYLILR